MLSGIRFFVALPSNAAMMLSLLALLPLDHTCYPVDYDIPLAGVHPDLNLTANLLSWTYHLMSWVQLKAFQKHPTRSLQDLVSITVLVLRGM